MSDQASRALEENFDRHQPIVFEGAAAGDQIHDRLGHAGERAKLHRAREVDELHRQVNALEISLGAAGELARHPAVGWQIQGPPVAAARFHGHRHAAAAEAQIHQGRHGQLVLPQHVLSHHPELGLAVGHIHGHIGVAHQQGPRLPAAAGHHQLAVVRVEQIGEIQACPLEAADGIGQQGALGQSDGEQGGLAAMPKQVA